MSKDLELQLLFSGQAEFNMAVGAFNRYGISSKCPDRQKQGVAKVYRFLHTAFVQHCRVQLMVGCSALAIE
jgi:hypothetical protein